MKFVRLSPNRIKIFVAEDELELWGLSVQHIIENKPEAQEIFWYIIKKAESETGFVAGESRLMVEALPQRGAGILLFMTKLEEEVETHLFGERDREPMRVEERIFSFPSFDRMCEALRELPPVKKSRLYEWQGEYVLVLEREDRRGSLDRLLEYGKEAIEPSDYHKAYLREHGNLLLKADAVETLRTYFG